MILDRLLTFTGPGTGSTPNYDLAAAVTNGADATNIIDLGSNFWNPTSAQGGGARDLGIGDDPALKLLVEAISINGLPLNPATSMSVTLNGAPDNGSGAPGATWYPLWVGPTIAAATLASQGVYLANVDLPRQFPGMPLPRFLKLTYTVTGTAPSTGGIYGGIVIDRYDQPWSFTTSGGVAYASAYPPGVLVPN